ncbi:GerMN domain-containing protein [Paenibacillus beijingensis]|uniref:GerMN domain-containing protein n=1 Tax=Paenibacillus beijingensis TaxID=1126833 RepID=A0A0D5NM48_9BACL|nr:GerMN domain-containing protein [Paenibacillus beijingensis]AJY76008.1 hypothetical protein VN24_17410 [Paenibacillus beijingensis]
MTIRYHWIRKAALAGALTLPLATAGCGFFSKETSQNIDPPPAEAQSGTQTTNAGAAAASADGQGAQSSMTVYLKDGNGYLAPVSLQTAEGTGISPGQRALELMVDDGPHASGLPQGFTAVLPKGTTVKSLHVDKNKLAVVEFSKSFTDYNPQDERSIVEAVTWTLTGISGIQKVELWCEGEKLSEMPVDGFPLDQPLTRAVGINLEQQQGTASRSTPVTLYFSAQTEAGDSYYVPVTRLVPRSGDSMLKTAMTQLIAGPLDSSALTGVMLPDVGVKDISASGDTVTVDLQDAQYKKGEKVPSEMLQAVVLSLTETSGASKVQIKLNGSSDYKDDNNASYSAPVSRPEHLNAFKS